MNYLAHLFLSGDSEELMVGNFIADSVKGGDLSRYSKGVQEGIIMHRRIDSYTDRHPVTAKSKLRLRPVYHKYAGVIVDIYYDHFLAANWDDYAAIPLEKYARSTYRILLKHIRIFPKRSVRFYGYMTAYNVLVNYGKTEGIKKVMQGMARRARFDSGMEHATNELLKDYALYGQEFKEFFPELVKEVAG